MLIHQPAPTYSRMFGNGKLLLTTCTVTSLQSGSVYHPTTRLSSRVALPSLLNSSAHGSQPLEQLHLSCLHPGFYQDLLCRMALPHGCSQALLHTSVLIIGCPSCVVCDADSAVGSRGDQNKSVTLFFLPLCQPLSEDGWSRLIKSIKNY